MNKTETNKKPNQVQEMLDDFKIRYQIKKYTLKKQKVKNLMDTALIR